MLNRVTVAVFLQHPFIFLQRRIIFFNITWSLAHACAASNVQLCIGWSRYGEEPKTLRVQYVGSGAGVM